MVSEQQQHHVHGALPAWPTAQGFIFHPKYMLPWFYITCFMFSTGLLHLMMQEWAAQLNERNWRNAVLLHNTNLFLHDWLKRAALKEGFCAFCCRSAPSAFLSPTC